MLNHDAAPNELLDAVAANHRREWMASARGSGGETRRFSGAACIWSPGPPDGRVTIAFPDNDTPLDAVLDYCRRRDPLPGSVGCWAMRDENDPATRALGVRLAARGFEWGWQAHWMSLDLATLSNTENAFSPGSLRVAVVDEPSPLWDVDDLPYYSREAAIVARERPVEPPPASRRRDRWHFAAWQNEKIVGHVTLFVTTGPLGAAGVYGMGVVPAARNQGVGRALLQAACRHARELGYRHALLNATGAGEPLYRRVGFVSVGRGQTWWLHKKTLEAPPPAPAEIAFAETLGWGDAATLDAQTPPPADLDAPLANGQTPFQFAARAGQSASADWLLARDATPDVVAAWDLGWKDRVRALLAARPELANAGTPHTPLHEAVLRDDAELARVLLAANPDLTIEDPEYHSTPLGWARHLKRDDLAVLIEAHEKRQT